MSKWMGNIVTTLIVLALTSLVGALLKGPIEDLASGNRLQAQVLLAPWIEKPADQDNPRKSSEPDTYEEILHGLIDDLQSTATSDYGVAKINIENNSSVVVKNVNFRLNEPYGEFEYLIVGADVSSPSLLTGNRVTLPDMKPGDRVSVFMWGGFSSYLFPDKFQSYSSEGAFRVSFDWPQTEEYVFRSWIGILLDEWAWTIFVISLILLGLMLLAYVLLLGEYIRTLFKDSSFFEIEQARFEGNPKKFEPKLGHEVTPAGSAIPSSAPPATTGGPDVVDN